MNPDRRPPLTLDELYAPFGAVTPAYREVEAARVAQPYRRLLAHDGHMTTTLERYHGQPVRLQVVETRHTDPIYSRKILLRRSSDGGVVQFGIMRFDFRHCSSEVRQAILEQATPLGRILIENEVLRHVDRHALLSIEPDRELATLFDLRLPATPVWGRLATIYCDGEPAVGLLEVVPPVGDDLEP